MVLHYGRMPCLKFTASYITVSAACKVVMRNRSCASRKDRAPPPRFRPGAIFRTQHHDNKVWKIWMTIWQQHNLVNKLFCWIKTSNTERQETSWLVSVNLSDTLGSVFESRLCHSELTHRIRQAVVLELPECGDSSGIRLDPISVLMMSLLFITCLYASHLGQIHLHINIYDDEP